LRMLIDRPSSGATSCRRFAAPHHRREGLVCFRPWHGQAALALSRRRSRQTTGWPMSSPSCGQSRSSGLEPDLDRSAGPGRCSEMLLNAGYSGFGGRIMTASCGLVRRRSFDKKSDAGAPSRPNTSIVLCYPSLRNPGIFPSGSTRPHGRSLQHVTEPRPTDRACSLASSVRWTRCVTLDAVARTSTEAS